MRAYDFIVDLFTRFVPMADSERASLKTNLQDYYIKNLNTLELKMETNQKFNNKIETINSELDNLDSHTPEYQEKLKELESIKFLMEKPSFQEKVIAFFEKPLTRTAFMILFVIGSRFIMKKLTEKPVEKPIEEEEEEEVYPNQPNYGHPNYGHPQQWQGQNFNPYFYPQNPNAPYNNGNRKY